MGGGKKWKKPFYNAEGGREKKGPYAHSFRCIVMDGKLQKKKGGTLSKAKKERGGKGRGKERESFYPGGEGKAKGYSATKGLRGGGKEKSITNFATGPFLFAPRGTRVAKAELHARAREGEKKGKKRETNTTYCRGGGQAKRRLAIGGTGKPFFSKKKRKTNHQRKGKKRGGRAMPTLARKHV